MHFILLPFVNIIVFSILLLGFILSLKISKLSFAVIISRLFFVVGCILFVDATYEGIITNTIIETGALYFEFGLITMISSSIIVAIRQNKLLHKSK